MEKRAQKKNEIMIGLIILAVLALICMRIILKQYGFSSPVTAQSAPKAVETGTGPGSSTESASLISLPENFSVMTPLEIFTPDTLYEKINGQADLYLGSGFFQLKCQRFVHPDSPDMWFEVFKYDMGTADHAFSVYSQQYRDDGQSLDWAPFGYSVANALFFVHGQDYIEMRTNSTSHELMMVMHTVAKEYVENNALETVTIAGIGWFPEQGLNPKSITMVSSNAFGFERLNRVYTARYLIDGKTVTAFISQRADDQEAAELAFAFGRFYSQFGGQELTTGFPSPNGKTIEIMDSIHIIFSEGIYLAGVHEAQDMDVARELASRLHTKIGTMKMQMERIRPLNKLDVTRPVK